MSGKEIIQKAKEIHPEAVNDLEAVDLYSLDVHHEAMKAADDKFYHLSVSYNHIRNVYRDLLYKMPVLD